jgi:hypothetical protein
MTLKWQPEGGTAEWLVEALYYVTKPGASADGGSSLPESPGTS